MKNKKSVFIPLLCVLLLFAGCSKNTNEKASGYSYASETVLDNINDGKDFSQKENAVVVAVSNGKKGEEVTGSLSIEGKVDMCAINTKIIFDSTKLRLTKLESDNSAVIINENKTDGGINVNFLEIENKSEPFEICTFTFEVITDEECEAAVVADVKEIVKIDGDDIIDCPYTTVDGVCRLN